MEEFINKITLFGSSLFASGNISKILFLIVLLIAAISLVGSIGDVLRGHECKTKLKDEVSVYRFGIKSVQVGMIGIIAAVGLPIMFSTKNIDTLLTLNPDKINLYIYCLLYAILFACVQRVRRKL